MSGLSKSFNRRLMSSIVYVSSLLCKTVAQTCRSYSAFTYLHALLAVKVPVDVVFMQLSECSVRIAFPKTKDDRITRCSDSTKDVPLEPHFTATLDFFPLVCIQPQGTIRIGTKPRNVFCEYYV